MKTYRIIIGVLSLVVVGLAYFAWSTARRPEGEMVKEMWHTNTMERWFTNTVERWRTNSLEVSRSTTLTQPVTNEVIKEVPAKLTALQKRAATIGYKYINAPALELGNDALYKARPIAVDVQIEASALSIVTDDPATIRKKIELALTARDIPVAEKSPHHLSLRIGRVWMTDVPGVALLASKLELKENVVLQRKGDFIKGSAIVWSTATSKLARSFNAPQEADACMQESVEKFCDSYLKTKQAEKLIESRVPNVPRNFLAQDSAP